MIRRLADIFLELLEKGAVNCVTRREFERVLDYALEIGIENGFIQEGMSAKESFIPAFDYKGI